MNEVLVECQNSALQKVDWLLTMENKAPFTLTERYLVDYREKYLQSYRDARAPQLRGGNNNLRPEELVARDTFDQALQYMASARGYFQGLHWSSFLTFSGSLTVSSVAFKRFTDVVPMAIDQELLRGLDWDRGLHTTLTRRLEITGPGSLDKAKEYLQEPPDVVSRREILLKKRERLQLARRELQSI